jgi:hypothetical protein
MKQISEYGDKKARKHVMGDYSKKTKGLKNKSYTE